MKPVEQEEVLAYGVWTRHIRATEYDDVRGEGTAAIEGDRAADYLPASKNDGPSGPPCLPTCCDPMEGRELLLLGPMLPYVLGPEFFAEHLSSNSIPGSY